MLVPILSLVPDYLEIKVRLDDTETNRRLKKDFETAAATAQPKLSLSQWLIVAGMEKLGRDGQRVPKDRATRRRDR